MPEAGAAPGAVRVRNKCSPEQEEGAGGALDEQAHTGSHSNGEQKSPTSWSQSERLGKLSLATTSQPDEWLRGTLSAILSRTANRENAFYRLTAEEHCLGRSEQPGTEPEVPFGEKLVSITRGNLKTTSAFFF